MEQSLMQKFADPQLFQSLGAGEKMEGALITTLMGMGITFIILSLLLGIIVLMAKIVNATDKRAALATAGSGSVTMTTSNGEANSSVVFSERKSPEGQTLSPEDNPELVAVIMAAIAASEGSEFVNHFVVRRINRMAGNPPAWGRAGTTDAIDSRKF